MTFPQTRLDQRVELFVSGAWVNISAYALQRDVTSITRGRDEGAAYVDTGTLTLTLNNNDYRFSPRNPMSPYYGLIGRNTPIRVSAGLGKPFLSIPGISGAHAEAPDSAGLSITGDTEIILDVELNDWSTDGQIGLATKVGSWIVWHWDGKIYFRWYDTALTNLEKSATVTTPIPFNKRCALKILLDVDNGAGGNTVTFSTAPTSAGPWTQLGSPVVTAGTTAVYNSTGKVYLGQEASVSSTLPQGRIHGFQLRNGSAGAVAAAVDFTVQTPDAASFADSQGNTWTMAGGAQLTNRRYRFHGEVAEWPIKSDISGDDRYVTIEANGVMRRLGRCTSTLPSALTRGYLNTVAGVRAYWPCEDLAGSRSVASAMPKGYPMSVAGPTDFGGYTDFYASRPNPLMKNSAFTGRVQRYTATGLIQFRFFVAIPSGGSTAGGVLARIYTTGDVAYWELRYGTGAGAGYTAGRLRFLAYDNNETVVFDTVTYYDYQLDGKLAFIHIQIDPTAGSPDISIYRYVLGEGAAYGWSWDHSIVDLGRVTSVAICPDKNHDDVMISHISVQDAITSIFDAQELMVGYLYERAGNRIRRLCIEAGIEIEAKGDFDDTEEMGTQTPDSLLNLLRESAETDGGILYESRDALGLSYVPRRTMYAQTAAIALDVETDHHLSAPLDPIDDDSLVVNDMTVVRKNGSSARVEIEAGPLSLLDPPDGVGRYEQSATLCLGFDERCQGMAEWLVSIGTQNAARYPSLSLNLARDAITGDVDLLTLLMDLEQGMLISLGNLPPDQPPDGVDLLTWGSRETLDSHSYTMQLSCVPEGPMRTGVWDADSSRYDSAASVLHDAIDDSETSLLVTISDGALWTRAAGDFPFDIVIGGERMAVTAIASATSPQTFTVTRSVNGIVKAHDSAAPVSLFRPVHWGA